MLARTGGSEGATEGCGSLLPWHWPCALVVEQLTAAPATSAFLVSRSKAASPFTAKLD